MNPCRETRRAQDYLDGELTAAQAQRVFAKAIVGDGVLDDRETSDHIARMDGGTGGTVELAGRAARLDRSQGLSARTR